MKKILTILAWIISIIFHPIGIATLGCALVSSCYVIPIFDDVTFNLAFSAITKAIIPIFELYYVLPLVLCGIFTFLFRKRIKFDSKNYRIVTMSIIVYVFSISSMNSAILTAYKPYLLACSVAVALACIISFFWRISLHTMGMGGLIAIQCSLLFIGSPFSNIAIRLLPIIIIIAGLVGSARLYLEAHSPAQIYVGYVVGFLAIALFLLFFC